MDKSERLGKFFKDGKTMIVPIDHGTAIPVPGLENPAEIVKLLSPWASGFVVNAGVARACRDELEGKGVCFRTDIYKPGIKGQEDLGSVTLYNVEEAIGFNADATMNMLYVNHAHEVDMVASCASLVADGEAYGIPLIIEALPLGIGRPKAYTVENIGFTVRIAAELGADVVKTAYPTDGSVDDFKRIVDACFVPVIVLGGAAMGDDRALLQMVHDSMAAGASGIAIGRNVFMHENPAAIAKKLHAIIHKGAGVDDALALT